MYSTLATTTNTLTRQTDKQGDSYIPTQNLILCIENSVTHFILSVNTNSKELIYNVLLDCSSKTYRGGTILLDKLASSSKNSA